MINNYTGIQRVTLTQEHISNGKVGVCETCPIAQCLMSNGFTSVAVDYTYAYMVDYAGEDSEHFFATPYAMSDRANDFMRDFDVSLPVRTGTLIINHDDKWIDFESHKDID